MAKPAIVIKITGTLFVDQKTQKFSRTIADELVKQLATLHTTHQVGIVIGGGAFFRGAESNGTLRLRPAIAHSIGMLATITNALMLYDVLFENNIASTMLCAFHCDLAGATACQQTIASAIEHDHIIIFSGGTGNPYVSSDTAAIIRAKQLGAQELWKATTVDGVYTADPYIDCKAELIPNMTHQEALDKHLGFMDYTAITLAQQERLPIRVFNVAAPHALLKAAQCEPLGTIIRT